jgi:cyclopropane fatty-acyl-phospholipid synthase-like methyltransferase
VANSTDDHRRWLHPSAERNKAPIRAVLQRVLPATGFVLEIGSGSGQHVVHFAAAMPALTWQPSDPEPECRQSIELWIAHEKLTNVRPPLALDVRDLPWPVEHADAIVSINMIHIAPWTAAEALVTGAGAWLPPNGVLFLYGPFRRYGRHTAVSNDAFDTDLRARNPAWGVRDLEAMVALAHDAGLHLAETVDMPANNLSVVFRKRKR